MVIGCRRIGSHAFGTMAASAGTFPDLHPFIERIIDCITLIEKPVI
jgi:hypothetical protein